jgi:hypothetical protein
MKDSAPSTWGTFQFETDYPLATPSRISPTDGETFKHYPRVVTLTWTPVNGATGYKVECQRWAGGWQSERDTTVTGFAATSYTFTVTGDNPIQWRITAIGDGSTTKDSAPSTWGTFQFDTSLDTTPPYVASVDPIAGAIDVSVDKTITVTFNEDVLFVAGDPYGIALRDSAGNDVPASVSYGTTATLDPADLLEHGMVYTIRAWGAKDLAGNLMANEFTSPFTTVSNQPPVAGIAVTAPNGGENWTQGTTHPITWTYSGDIGSTVRIGLYKNNVWQGNLISGISAGSGGIGSWTWNVPWNQAPGSDYTIRVTSVTDSSVYDYSNGKFTILSNVTPTITVTSPNGGENWARGSTHSITWTYTGDPGSTVKIAVYKGGVWQTNLISGYSRGSRGVGSFIWRIPSKQTTGSDYNISVTSMADSTINDMSNGDFMIS